MMGLTGLLLRLNRPLPSHVDRNSALNAIAEAAPRPGKADIRDGRELVVATGDLTDA